ncbi:MAG: Uma2 family endonuclease, partial [Rhodoferax sp.]|nr:Uma2 family endonuclease [Rhodoferax sp.]NCP55239.1 Uma2 family endonuclease [Rhodoferax sp.]
RKLPSLQHYLLVSQEKRSVQWHQRDAAGQWLVSDLQDSGTLDLACPGLALTLTLDDVYEDVTLS